jgi:hypothetical protein
MSVVLVVTFKSERTIEEEKAHTEKIIPQIAAQNGFVAKLWTANEPSGDFAGIYEFETREDAQSYLGSDVIKGLESTPFLLSETETKIFDIYRKQVGSSVK